MEELIGKSFTASCSASERCGVDVWKDISPRVDREVQDTL